jgi:hypothetical protein
MDLQSWRGHRGGKWQRNVLGAVAASAALVLFVLRKKKGAKLLLYADIIR